MQLLPGATDAGTDGDLDSPDACARALLGGLPPVMWFIRRHMRKHRSGGLSVPQFRALALVHRTPKATLSLVAEYMGTSQPSASRLITGLVSKGFITRKECSKDRRQVSLVLTPRGSKAFESAQSATQQRLAEKIQSLDEADRSAIGAAMQKLQDVFSKNDCETGDAAKQGLKKLLDVKPGNGAAIEARETNPVLKTVAQTDIEN